jgi:hypothetical protein
MIGTEQRPVMPALPFEQRRQAGRSWDWVEFGG